MSVNRSLISPTSNTLLEEALRSKLGRRAETTGSLGELEPLAVRLGLIQNTLKPRFRTPQIAMKHAHRKRRHAALVVGSFSAARLDRFCMTVRFSSQGAVRSFGTRDDNHGGDAKGCMRGNRSFERGGCAS